MTRAAAMLAALACTACASGAVEGDVANYDNIRAAQQACADRGGSLGLVRNGDPQVLGDWVCRRK